MNDEPAFPMIKPSGCDTYGLQYRGLSIRDYFATAAMQGWLASWPKTQAHPVDKNEQQAEAKRCYAIADAMIAERLKQ